MPSVPFFFSILYTNLKIDIKLAKNKIKHYKNIQNAAKYFYRYEIC